MKQKYFLIIVLQIWALCTWGQQRLLPVDSLENSFESISPGVNMPCKWVMTVERKENGKLRFWDKDSTGLEFDFFKISSLPFYEPSQTAFETIRQYYYRAVQKQNSNANFKITNVEEDKDAGFIIFKIQDTSSEYYRLVGRKREILCSIKLYATAMPLQDQLEKLKLLYDLNK